MAVTSLTLVWLGTVALLATLGLFYTFSDQWTGVLVEFVAAVLWAMFAISGMNVTITGSNPPVSEPMMPLVYIGIGFALLTFLFAMSDLVQTIRGDAAQLDLSDVGGPQ